MEKEEIESKLREEIALAFEIDEAKILPDTNFRNDLAFDSLNMVDVALIVESCYPFIHIPNRDLGGIRTLHEIVEVVYKGSTLYDGK